MATLVTGFTLLTFPKYFTFKKKAQAKPKESIPNSGISIHIYYHLWNFSLLLHTGLSTMEEFISFKGDKSWQMAWKLDIFYMCVCVYSCKLLRCLWLQFSVYFNSCDNHGHTFMFSLLFIIRLFVSLWGEIISIKAVYHCTIQEIQHSWWLRYLSDFRVF